jgi:periplasmic protein TonB
MTSRALFLPLLFLGTAIAQDSAPISLTGKDAALVCRGKAKHAPGCITPPHPTYTPDPAYPKKAREARQQGTVRFRLVVGADGLPRDIAVDRPLSPELDEAAMNAVKRWKFDPATKDGRPVSVQINVEVQFALYQ